MILDGIAETIFNGRSWIQFLTGDAEKVDRCCETEFKQGLWNQWAC